MRVSDRQLDIEISNLRRSGANQVHLELLLELRRRRFHAKLWRGVGARFSVTTVSGWCLIASALTFWVGFWAAAAMPTRTVSALLAGVSIFLFALALLLPSNDPSADREVEDTTLDQRDEPGR